MDTVSNSLTKSEDNGILNNKTKTTTNQLKKNLNQSAESISPTSKASVNNLKEKLSKHNIKSTFHTTTTLHKILSSPKDPIPTEKKHNIIYKLDCKDCDVVYIGESKRAYQTQIG